MGVESNLLLILPGDCKKKKSRNLWYPIYEVGIEGLAKRIEVKELI